MFLSSLREDIDKIDEKIVKLLNERFSCCEKIAKLKKSSGLRLVDLNRQAEVLSHVASCSIRDYVDLNKLVFETIMVLSSVAQLEQQTKFPD